ncbi:unnamed protein product [Polarella glacialis]|uniref:CS domain-containing protein n=1 Tax=Polarella glacialis TaxID=89957 RepID=A0A813LJ49_POLGL|nr:unnamed protein product [Polarella glacialis]
MRHSISVGRSAARILAALGVSSVWQAFGAATKPELPDVGLPMLQKAQKALSSGRPEDAVAVSTEDMDVLVLRGYHAEVQGLVELSHKGSEEDAQRVANQVRQAVKAERNRLDDLLRALDRNYGRAAEVSPAAQWAQNSTHIFLSIKFAQRWNAPGALEVENSTVDFSDCCFNFTAFGEHSFIVRRYHLSWTFLFPIVPKASSWHAAASGRISVFIAKAEKKEWSSLLQGQAPKNLGIWLDMQATWDAELEESREKSRGQKTNQKKTSVAPAPQKGGGKAGKKKVAKDDDDEDEEDSGFERELELISRCGKSSYSGTSVAELCDRAWANSVEKTAVPGRTWLIQLYNGQGKGDAAAMKTLMPVWKRLAEVFPQMLPKGRVGAVDCSQEKELCSQLMGSKTASEGEGLPVIWRYGGGRQAGERWTGSLTSASLEELADFGSSKKGKSEL